MHLLNAELACKIHNWRRVSRPIIGDCVDQETVLRGGQHIKGGLKCGDTCAKTDIKAAERGLHCLSVLHRERGAPSFTQSVSSIFGDRKGSRSEAERNTAMSTTTATATTFGTHSKRKTNAVSHKSPSRSRHHLLNGK